MDLGPDIHSNWNALLTHKKVFGNNLKKFLGMNFAEYERYGLK
jgi:hypothetical protein